MVYAAASPRAHNLRVDATRHGTCGAHARVSHQKSEPAPAWSFPNSVCARKLLMDKAQRPVADGLARVEAVHHLTWRLGSYCGVATTTSPQETVRKLSRFSVEL